MSARNSFRCYIFRRFPHPSTGGVHTLLSKVREMMTLQRDQISGDVEAAFGYPHVVSSSTDRSSSGGLFRHAQPVGCG
jgi:hypothetical protein